MEKIPTVNEALSQMAADGITDVFIQPTHVINGIENDIMKADALKFRDSFDSISFGVPLLSSTQDMEELVHIIIEAFPSLGNDEVLILMGHGSEHYANMAYAALDYMFKQKGYSQIYVGTVEACLLYTSHFHRHFGFMPPKRKCERQASNPSTVHQKY